MQDEIHVQERGPERAAEAEQAETTPEAPDTAHASIPTFVEERPAGPPAPLAPDRGASFPCPEPPLGLDLISDGGFEAPGVGWSIEAGACDWSEDQLAPQGARAMVGGDGGDCEAVQRIALPELTVCPLWVDRGALAVSLAVQARTADSPTPDNGDLSPWDTVIFDDHAWLEVRFYGGDGALLATARTPVSERNEWTPAGGVVILPEGTRALEIAGVADHRRGAFNDGALDDVSVTLVEAPTDTPVITKQPVVYQGAQDELTLLWETSAPAAGHTLWMSLDGAPTQAWDGAVETLVLAEDRHVHRARLAGLPPGAELTYKVASGRGEDKAIAGPYTTRTLPDDDTLRVIWTGDNQIGAGIFTQMVEQLTYQDADLFFSVGDIVQDGLVEEDWDEQWFAPLETGDFGSTTPILFARGNHDHEWTLAYSYTELPGNGAWYAQRLGPVFFLVMDSQWDPTDAEDLSNQALFIEEALASEAATAADFRVVSFHLPPYTNIWKTSDWDGEEDLREEWMPLFEEGGVDLLVTGHTHAYQRGELRGVTHVVTGGAGGTIDTHDFGHWPFFEQSVSEHHYSVMEVADGTLRWKTHSLSGNSLDTFVLQAD